MVHGQPGTPGRLAVDHVTTGYGRGRGTVQILNHSMVVTDVWGTPAKPQNAEIRLVQVLCFYD